MCLGIPMQIKKIEGYTATCEAKGISRETSLFMLDGLDVKVGDFVLIHVGYAIQIIDEVEARTAWETYDEMLRLEKEALS